MGLNPRELRDALVERGLLAEEENGGSDRGLVAARGGGELSEKMRLWNWRSI